MKKHFFYTVLFVLSSVFGVYAQADDQLITKTVNDFLEGGTNGEVDRFRNAFTKDAVQRAMGKTGVVGMTVESLASKIKPGQKMDRSTKIVSISYANDAATAITETEYSTNKIIDLLNLLKVGNDWKIISRVYSRVGLDESVNTVGEAASRTPASKPAAAKAKPAPKPKKPADDDGW